MNLKDRKTRIFIQAVMVTSAFSLIHAWLPAELVNTWSEQVLFLLTLVTFVVAERLISRER